MSLLVRARATCVVVFFQFVVSSIFLYFYVKCFLEFIMSSIILLKSQLIATQNGGSPCYKLKCIKVFSSIRGRAQLIVSKSNTLVVKIKS